MWISALLIASISFATTDPPHAQGWAYLGHYGCDTSKYWAYKKKGSENEFMLADQEYRTYYKMETRRFFKMSDEGKIWECEFGGRSDLPDRFYCHFIHKGVDQYSKCLEDAYDISKNAGPTHSMTASEHEDFMYNVQTKMCKRNWAQTFDSCKQKALELAYDARTFEPPDWDQVDQQSKQARAQEMENRRQDEKDEAQQDVNAQPSPTAAVDSSGKIQILENSSGACTLVITNTTVYEFDIKINGVAYGVLPTRKVARIGDLNCDGFMAEAWPKGTVTGSVHRAFQHNQKDNNNNFYWNLRYK